MLFFVARVVWLIWCWIELSVSTLILYALAWLPIANNAIFYHKLFRLWCKIFVRALGVNLRLHQKNLRPLPKQYILIANHPSAFEDVGIPALFDIYPLAKMGVKNWFLVGRINVAAGTLFVKRDDKDSRRGASDKLRQVLQRGDSIALFPEGGCKGRRIYSDFKFGAFDISIDSGVPILPVFLHYEAQDTFVWEDPDTLIQKMWHFMTSQNNRAHYYVFDAIDPKDFSDKKEFAEHVHG
ncbi:MAG: lysophospholipid acyltransferase family protein, partial [Thiohalomonadales bacterium]